MASIRTAGLTKDYGWMSVALGIAAAAAAVALLVDVSEIAAVCESQESSHRHPSGPRFSRHSSGPRTRVALTIDGGHSLCTRLH